MSTDVKGQWVTFICDICTAEFEAAGEFKDVWAAAKQKGWRCFQIENGDWEHRCPDC